MRFDGSPGVGLDAWRHRRDVQLRAGDIRAMKASGIQILIYFIEINHLRINFLTIKLANNLVL